MSSLSAEHLPSRRARPEPAQVPFQSFTELTADERVAVAWALQLHRVQHEDSHLLSPGFDHLIASARVKLLAQGEAR